MRAQSALPSVDRDAAVPLYHQIYLKYRDEIFSGVRALGSLIPTERDIADSYGVSRITARRALEELAAQQLVVRKRRLGTQVIYSLPVQPIEANIVKAVESLMTFGRKTAVTVLEVTQDKAEEPIASLLRVRIASPLTRVVRLRWLDDEPLGYSIAYVPDELNVAITKDDLSNNPILALVTSNGREVGSASQTIAATLADHATAAKLRIDAADPLLLVTRAFRDKDDAPLLLTRTFYRADRYQVRVDFGATAPELD